MSPIHPFNVDDIPMYSPQFESSMPNIVDDGEEVEEVKAPKKKPSIRHQKRRLKRMMKVKGTFYRPLKKKLFGAKVGFVYQKIESLVIGERKLSFRRLF